MHLQGRRYVFPIFEQMVMLMHIMQGALLEEPIREGESLKINGSFLLATAETREELIKTLKEDIYMTAGIWDWNKLQVHPVGPCCGFDEQHAD